MELKEPLLADALPRAAQAAVPPARARPLAMKRRHGASPLAMKRRHEASPRSAGARGPPGRPPPATSTARG
jgi:hypothetical protein